MGALTMLNQSGDVTLIWNEENDDAMTETRMTVSSTHVTGSHRRH